VRIRLHTNWVNENQLKRERERDILQRKALDFNEFLGLNNKMQYFFNDQLILIDDVQSYH
jgi:hypothetical protein